MWCVTIDQLKRFVIEVRKEWRAGGIPDSLLYSNDRHHDPRHGPNMYQVNEHFVKPLTRAAGGMSYALMLHPRGLSCEVFISHAWAEGVFEFADAVLRAWPLGKWNLYCCLLANPQNLDISELLDVAPSVSPFADALKVASHVVVVPNSTVAVYTRLWCVYEAYLATRLQKVFLMPARAEKNKARNAFGRWLLTPVVLGVAVGLCLSLLPLAQTEEFRQNAGRALAFTTICNAFGVMLTALWPHLCLKPLLLQLFDAGLLFAYSVVGSSYFIASFKARPALETEMQSGVGPLVLRYLLVISVVVLNLGIVSQNVVCMLEDESLKLQVERLHFESVRHAICSNEQDSDRIWSEISGAEEDVDAAIQILVKAGAYTKSLSRQFQEGVDITRAGYADIYVRLFQGFQIWLTTALICGDRALHFRHHAIPGWLTAIPSIVCLLIALASPIWLLRCYRQGPDTAIFSGKTLAVAGVLGLSSALLVVHWENSAAMEHLLGGTDGQLAQLWDNSNPGLDMFVLFWPMIMALLAFVAIYIGPEKVCSKCLPFVRCVTGLDRRSRGKGQIFRNSNSEISESETSGIEADAAKPPDDRPVDPTRSAEL